MIRRHRQARPRTGGHRAEVDLTTSWLGREDREPVAPCPMSRMPGRAKFGPRLLRPVADLAATVGGGRQESRAGVRGSDATRCRNRSGPGWEPAIVVLPVETSLQVDSTADPAGRTAPEAPGTEPDRPAGCRTTSARGDVRDRAGRSRITPELTGNDLLVAGATAIGRPDGRGEEFEMSRWPGPRRVPSGRRGGKRGYRPRWDETMFGGPQRSR